LVFNFEGKFLFILITGKVAHNIYKSFKQHFREAPFLHYIPLSIGILSSRNLPSDLEKISAGQNITATGGAVMKSMLLCRLFINSKGDQKACFVGTCDCERSNNRIV
jgi:hypothetical protein